MYPNSNQQLGSVDPGANAADRGDVGPSAAWRTAFDEQLTPAAVAEVTACAARRASWIEHQTGIHDPLFVDEMVQNAIGDTFAQVVTWDPARHPLATHLKNVVRTRCGHELDRREEYEHVAIDTADEAEVSGALAARASGAAAISDYADEVAARMRVLAGDDVAVLRLLDLYLAGVTERRDVCRVGPMSKSTYHNAFRRLSRLVEDLPEHLVTAMRTAME